MTKSLIRRAGQRTRVESPQESQRLTQRSNLERAPGTGFLLARTGAMWLVSLFFLPSAEYVGALSGVGPSGKNVTLCQNAKLWSDVWYWVQPHFPVP